MKDYKFIQRAIVFAISFVAFFALLCPGVAFASFEEEVDYEINVEDDFTVLPDSLPKPVSCFGNAACDDTNICTDEACVGVTTLNEDTLGTADSYFSGTVRTRGNFFECTVASILTGAGMYLNLTGTAEIDLVVYESSTLSGSYTPIFTTGTTFIPAGNLWYAFSSISVPLSAGKFYGIAYTWNSDSVGYYTYSATTSDPVSFGNRVGYVETFTYNPATLLGLNLPSAVGYNMVVESTVSGNCQYSNNTDPCDDGLFCNGDDTCGVGTCSVHTDDVCLDNGVWCDGDEICDEINDLCDIENVPDCSDDGLFCTGVESCDEVNDQCATTGDPCDPATESCNEDADTCDPLVDDDDDDDDDSGCCG